MGCGAARTSTLQVLVLTFILIISSTVAGPIIAQLTCSHKLVGYMLLGFVCTERMLDMIVTAHALDDLKWVMVLCKAFTAFETATQLASAGELKYYVKSVSFAAVSYVAACFGAGLFVLLGLLGTQGFATVPDCNSQPIGKSAPCTIRGRLPLFTPPPATVRRCPRARWWLCDGDGRCHWSSRDCCRAEHVRGHRDRGACAGTDTHTHTCACACTCTCIEPRMANPSRLACTSLPVERLHNLNQNTSHTRVRRASTSQPGCGYHRAPPSSRRCFCCWRHQPSASDSTAWSGLSCRPLTLTLTVSLTLTLTVSLSLSLSLTLILTLTLTLTLTLL